MSKKKLVISEELNARIGDLDMMDYLYEQDLVKIENLEAFVDKWEGLNYDQKEAFKAILEGYDDDPKEAIEIIFKGDYYWIPNMTLAEYTEQLCDDMGVPQSIMPYVDIETLGNDFASSRDMYEGNGGLIEIE